MKDISLAYECQKCCISCNEDKKKCEYRKARERLTRREMYRLKKEQEKKKVNGSG